MIGEPSRSAPENSRKVCPNELAPEADKAAVAVEDGQARAGDLLLGDRRPLRQRAGSSATWLCRM